MEEVYLVDGTKILMSRKALDMLTAERTEDGFPVMKLESGDHVVPSDHAKEMMRGAGREIAEYDELPSLPVGETINVERVGRYYDDEGGRAFVFADGKKYRVDPSAWERAGRLVERVIRKQAATGKRVFPVRVVVDRDLTFFDDIAADLRRRGAVRRRP